MTARFAYRADTIEIIDFVPVGHSQTARHLEQHIEDLKYDPSVVQIPLTRRRVVTAPELYAELSQVAITQWRRISGRFCISKLMAVRTGCNWPEVML